VRKSRTLFSAVLAGACALGLAGGLAVAAGPGAAHSAAAHRTAAHPAVASRAAGGQDAALTALLRPATATAGDPIFMFIKGIPGEAIDKLHPKWIAVSGYHTSFSRTCGDCPTSMGSFTVTMPYSLAVPPLLKVLINGTGIPSVELQAAVTTSVGGEVNYLTITLTNVLITSMDELSGGGRPVETLTLTATKFSVSYTALNASGRPGATSAFCFDFAARTAC
jgi:type VI protein secretion system component Hcp